ncbi:MAG: cell division protein ZapE [Planctomycetota bacterium]|jgi:cell division protein ZapE|nr:cell division protein ZapE [Planctomycetota bacterium]
MLLDDIAGRVHAPHEADDFVPPPRFADKTFDGYRIDASVSGQESAVDQVRDFAGAGRKRLWEMWRRGEKPGLYLDGDFGVGKTHLLAAAFHAAQGTRRYLSFSEMISLAVLEGPKRCVEILRADLVCVDEFELDDPSNTRLADLVLDGLFGKGVRVILTSNTVPGELGAEHVFVQLLRRQLARVQAHFDDVHVPGEDYRQRHRRDGEDPSGWGAAVVPFAIIDGALALDAHELDRFLTRIPVVSLRRVAGLMPALTITEMRPWDDQLSAIRFVHLIDRLYDWKVPLRVQAACPIADVFKPEYRELGYRKKYRRCLSRLTELCAEGGTLAD